MGYKPFNILNKDWHRVLDLIFAWILALAVFYGVYVIFAPISTGLAVFVGIFALSVILLDCLL